MQPHQLANVVAVAETGSFTRGARRAQVVPSAESAAITRLERQLGAALFERPYHRVVLTASGEALLPRAHTDIAAPAASPRGRDPRPVLHSRHGRASLGHRDGG